MGMQRACSRQSTCLRLHPHRTAPHHTTFRRAQGFVARMSLYIRDAPPNETFGMTTPFRVPYGGCTTAVGRLRLYRGCR